MARSQRHSIYIRGTDASGKGLSEKQPANVYLAQYIASQAFTVPTGPAGGPLQGSSVAGFPPTLIPPPSLYEVHAAELDAAGEFTDPGQFNLSGNPKYEDLPTPGAPPEPPPPDPEPGMEPQVASLNPNTAEIGGADLEMHVIGTNFTDTSIIIFNGVAEPTIFVSDTDLSTIVRPSTATVAGPLPVSVVQGSYMATPPLEFTFTDVVVPGTRSIPLGPFTVTLIDDHDDGIAITFTGDGIHVGDTVLVEATGNTSINGSYPVLAVDGNVIVVDNPAVLSAPIEAKGRLTVTAGAS